MRHESLAIRVPVLSDCHCLSKALILSYTAYLLLLLEVKSEALTLVLMMLSFSTSFSLFPNKHHPVLGRTYPEFARTPCALPVIP